MPAPIEAIDIDGADKEHGPLESTGKDVLRAVHIVAPVALPGQIFHTVPVCQCREMDDAVSVMRGQVGETVKITVLRGIETIDFNVVRREVNINYVEYWRK